MNRFIVPLPAQIVAAFGRVIVDESILHRFLQTAFEGLSAVALIIAVGVPLGFPSTAATYGGGMPTRAGSRPLWRRPWCWPIRFFW